ncbi:MAG: metal-dependent hydrolase [Candidatus Altiarchaeales archaeon WOR_SM1_79]|nr:MAG: metal-dependent hydrolase [Candidatus Altiarchaeales archaeon WOR_SM1_79]
MLAQPILDNHIHLQPLGKNYEAVREFQREGGTHLIVSHLPHKGYKITKPEDFKTQFDTTLKMALLAREKTDIKIFVTVGPYPVELLRLAERTTIEEGVKIMMAGMDIAGEYVKEGKAIALGEIGRPHFPVSDEIMSASNDIMGYGMKIAKEIGCAVVLHTESGTPKVCKELAEIGEDVGLPSEKIVKHYSPAIIDKKDNYGLFPSVLASKKNIEEAVAQGSRFMMETDYLDDPRRPGAVLGIKTVPKRTMNFIKNGLLSEEDAWIIHKDNPEKVYGIEID